MVFPLHSWLQVIPLVITSLAQQTRWPVTTLIRADSPNYPVMSLLTPQRADSPIYLVISLLTPHRADSPNHPAISSLTPHRVDSPNYPVIVC